MKKILLLFISLIGVCAFGQGNSSTLKLGYFSPGMGGGFIVGYEGSKVIDEVFSFGWSIDWYHTNYVDKKVVNDFNNWYGSGGQINELRAKTNLHDLPIMGAFTATFPIRPFYKMYVTGSLGGEILIVNYSNFQDPSKSETKGSFGFNWQIAAGALYEFGRRSDLFLELGYHNASPGWEYEVDNPNGIGKKTYERIFDMSGMMIRTGVKFYF